MTQLDARGKAVLASIIAAALCYLCIAGTMVAVMWRARKEFSVRARAPALAVASGVANIIVSELILVQEALRTTGHKYPCSLILWTSFFYAPLVFVPYGLRALRVLVMLGQASKREKYGWLLSDRTAALMLTASALCMSCAAIAINLTVSKYNSSGSGSEVCLLFDQWALFLPLLVAFLCGALMIAEELIEARDRLNMAPELMWCFTALGFFGGTYMMLVILVRHAGAQLDSR
jgi:TRAP-type C4-dicarboxylate transport system permease small subunit